MNTIKSKSYLHGAVWIAAIIVGLAAVLYARMIFISQTQYFIWFKDHMSVVSTASPFLFVIATFLVRRFAPDAKGSGIPQVLLALEADRSSTRSTDHWHSSLVSTRTAIFKVLSSVIGILGGASIRREGPSVQIAASGFAWVGRRIRKFIPSINFKTFLTAGAAAGVAAAFNTPLAGITFAIEEISEGVFGPFRQMVMLTVMISGITAQALIGDYLYFGQPTIPKPSLIVIPMALFIGLVSGALGGGFARLLAFPKLSRLPEHWLFRAFICGVLCSIIGYFTHGATAGSGYEVTKQSLEATDIAGINPFFPLLKLCTTVLSYLSGMAGGIFSPSLSIGAGIGMSIAKLAHIQNFKTCALLGMVSFFSAVVQAPLTAVIIVMEMTDEHILILPFMISAFLAQGIGRWFMPVPLYRFLANKHQEA